MKFNLLAPQAIANLRVLVESNIKTHCFYVDIYTSLNPNMGCTYSNIIHAKYLKPSISYKDIEHMVNTVELDHYVTNFTISYVYETGTYRVIHKNINSINKKVVELDLEVLLNYISLEL